jgi:protein TonB
MANIVLQAEPFDEYTLVAPAEPDRLPAMLFLAALIHGILIIGVTFNVALTQPPSDAISLEVTIVANPDQRIDQPEDAAYLAQASQEGGGNTLEQLRPSAPLQSIMPADNRGSEDGTGLLDATAHQRSADELLATVRQNARDVAIDPRAEPQPEDSRAIEMQAGEEITLPLPQEDRANLLIFDNDPRQLIISADTRESVVASYLDKWKRRVEAVGAAYLPELGNIGDISGSPTLTVTIDASGDLRDVVIRKSSGSTVLDLAALDILQRASPFNPFPPEITAEFDSVRFEYKWLFVERLVPDERRSDSAP